MTLIILYYSTKVECAGLCLSKENCYAFNFGNKKCNLMSQPNSAFDIDTDHGAMTICLDHKNWNPITVYADNNNIPPMCPSKYTSLFTSYLIVNNIY